VTMLSTFSRMLASGRMDLRRTGHALSKFTNLTERSRLECPGRHFSESALFPAAADLAHAPGPGRPFRHALDEEPGRLREVQRPGQVALNEHAFNARPKHFLI